MAVGYMDRIIQLGGCPGHAHEACAKFILMCEDVWGTVIPDGPKNWFLHVSKIHCDCNAVGAFTEVTIEFILRSLLT